MRLVFFPTAPSSSSGYGIAVKDDYSRLKVTSNDVVLWYTNVHDHQLKRDKDLFIDRPYSLSFHRINQTLKRHPSCEVVPSQLKNVDLLQKYDEIFCGDVIGYRALRKLFPDTKITVRFHNCFARIQRRIKALNLQISDLKFKMNLLTNTALEHEIFRDRNCNKIFISHEDRQYYESISGIVDDAEVWGMDLDINKAIEARNSYQEKPITKLVWFGGAESHKIDSIKWFRDVVFPELCVTHKDLEFHLYGKGTEKLGNNNEKVRAHGFFSGSDFPYKDTSLYVNPDLIGGGVKTKIRSYFEEGIPFISSTYGFEGFPADVIDSHFCLVVTPEKWVDEINSRINVTVR